MISILLFIFLTLVFAYFIGLPLYRKRPILFPKKSLYIITFLLISFTTSIWINTLLISLSGLAFLTLLFIITDFWIMLGITKADLINALNKSVLGVQAKSEPHLNGVRLNEPNGTIHLYCTFSNLSFVIFDLDKKSNKHKLLRSVFKKFIDNYNFTL